MLKQLTEGSVSLGWWLKMAVCWDVTLCSLLKVYWHLEVSAAFTIMVDEQSTCENEFMVIVVMTDYILQTSHSIWTKLKVCHWPGCLEQPNKSSVALHSINMWHQIHVQHTSVLANKFKIHGPHSQGGYWAQSPFMQNGQERWPDERQTGLLHQYILLWSEQSYFEKCVVLSYFTVEALNHTVLTFLHSNRSFLC